MTAQQFSMMDALCPPPPVPEPWTPPARREVTVRAYGGPHVLIIDADDPDPFEIEVRGVPCVAERGHEFARGFVRAMDGDCTGLTWVATYVADGPGSMFWSETGYRSFGLMPDDPDAIAALIERFIAAPAKDGNGCGGKLVRWWPGYIHDWQSGVSWSLTYPRNEMWTQWGPERHAEIWAEHDAKIAAAAARMWAEGIDPNDVGKPVHHKGRWPRFERGRA